MEEGEVKMADSRIQLEIENWIRMKCLPQQFGQPFTPHRLKLISGGYFNFDAVSADGSIVANISTSSSKTAGGNQAAAKIQKLRADMLFLTLIPAKTHLIVLSEEDMFALCLKEKKSGRVPEEIEFILAVIPDDLKNLLAEAKRIAAREVTPEKFE